MQARTATGMEFAPPSPVQHRRHAPQPPAWQCGVSAAVARPAAAAALLQPMALVPLPAPYAPGPQLCSCQLRGQLLSATVAFASPSPSPRRRRAGATLSTLKGIQCTGSLVGPRQCGGITGARAVDIAVGSGGSGSRTSHRPHRRRPPTPSPGPGSVTYRQAPNLATSCTSPPGGQTPPSI